MLDWNKYSWTIQEKHYVSLHGEGENKIKRKRAACGSKLSQSSKGYIQWLIPAIPGGKDQEDGGSRPA
jgi:hypothetical protein